MATPYPISTLTQLGKVCSPLSMLNILKKNALKNGTVNYEQSELIWLVTRTLEYSDAAYPLSLTTDTVGNYLYALCQPYIGAAFKALGEGSGGIIIVPGGQPINLRWVTMSFTVGEAGSPIADGESSFVIELSNTIFDSAAFGYSNSSPLPRTGTVPDGKTYAPTYTALNITFTLNYPVVDGEQYTLSFGRTV